MEKAALVALFTVRLRTPRRIAPKSLAPGSRGAAQQAAAEWQPAPMDGDAIPAKPPPEQLKVMRVAHERRAATSAAVAAQSAGGGLNDGPASCVVYRSQQRKGMYLYVQNAAALVEPSKKLSDVLALLGPLVDCGITIDLTSDSKPLGQGGTTTDVRQRLKASGFYLCRSMTAA